MKRIVMVIAKEMFRDEELQVPRDIFQARGFGVTVASSKRGLCRGKLGAEVNSDLLYTEIQIQDFDAVIFVGGSGCREYFDDAQAHELVRKCLDENCVIGAICSAPAILAKAGILKGRRACSFSDDKEALTQGGAVYLDQAVVRDGLVVTGNGHQASKEFAECIVASLTEQAQSSKA